MNRFFLATIVALSAFIFTSCGSDDEFQIETDDELVEMPVTLYPVNITKLSKVKMFTDGREVTDLKKIKRYTQDSKIFNSSDHYTSFFDSTSIVFTSKDSIVFNYFYGDEIPFYVKKDNGQFLFYQKGYEFTDSSAYLESISYVMLKYPTGLIPIDPATGYRYISKSVMVGYGSYKDLELSCIAYKIIHIKETPNQTFYSMVSTITQNEFDPRVVGMLGTRDTLAVQEFRIRFKAR